MKTKYERWSKSVEIDSHMKVAKVAKVALSHQFLAVGAKGRRTKICGHNGISFTKLHQGTS